MPPPPWGGTQPTESRWSHVVHRHQHDAVAELWEEHRRAPFPPRLRGVDIKGVDLLAVDSDLAGCIYSWMSNDRWLTDAWRSFIARRIGDIDAAMGALDQDEAEYYARLRELAAMVIEPDTAGG